MFISFQKNGVDYFEGTVKYYEKTIIVHLVIVAMIIMVLAISSGAYFTIKKAKPIIFKFGMLPPKNCCITLPFHWELEVYFAQDYCITVYMVYFLQPL